MEKAVASSATTNYGTPNHNGMPSIWAPVSLASSTAVSSADVMEGVSWVGSKIVFIKLSARLRCGPGPTVMGSGQTKPSQEDRQDVRLAMLRCDPGVFIASASEIGRAHV